MQADRSYKPRAALFAMMLVLAVIPGLGSLASAADVTLHIVADWTTLIPDGHGTFTDWNSDAIVSGNYVSFLASGTSSQQGIYLFDGSTLRRVADRTSSVPGSTGTF